RRAQNALLQTARGLVDHGEHAALNDLSGIDLAAHAANRLVNRLVDGALLPCLVVSVKALSTFAAGAAGGHDSSHRFGSRHTSAERLAQHHAHLAADVDADFVEECDGTHGKSEIDERAIDRVDGCAFIEQP